MIPEHFDSLILKAFEVNDRRRPPDAWIKDAWRRIGSGRSDDYIHAAMYRLQRNPERHLTTLLDKVQAETDAAMRRRPRGETEDTSCPTCRMQRVVVIRALKRSGLQRYGDQARVERYERPIFCDLAVPCPICAAGVYPHDLYRGYAWDLENSDWIQEPLDDCEVIPTHLLFPDELEGRPQSPEELSAFVRDFSAGFGNPGALSPPQGGSSRQQVLQEAIETYRNAGQHRGNGAEIADLPSLA